MVRIIEPAQIKCKACNCEFSFEWNDTRDIEDKVYVACPVCLLYNELNADGACIHEIRERNKA